MSDILLARTVTLVALVTSLAFKTQAGSCTQVADQTQVIPPPELSVSRLSPRAISLHFEGPQISNVIAILSSAGIVVIDTESAPSLGTLLKDRILEEFPGATIRAVINTHGHGDHTWGNQAFDGIEIIGHERVSDDMEAVANDPPEDAARIGSYLERLQARRAALDAGSPEVEELEQTISYFSTVKGGLEGNFRSTPPNLTFSERFGLDLGNVSLQLTFFPDAHSNSDVLIYCPEEGLLATGDLFVPRMRPPYLRNSTVGQLPRWIDALDHVLESSTPIRHVIPGHGEVLSKDDIQAVRDYLLSERLRIGDKEPAYPLFQRVMDERGPEEALSYLGVLAQEEGLYLLEGDLVSLGYGFLYQERAPAEAVLVFQTLTQLFPDSWNAWDCLGEASAEAGDIPLAIRSYLRSLDLNPENDHAERALRELR